MADLIANPISSVVDLIKDGLDKFGPADPQQKAAAQLAILQVAQAGHFKDLDNALAVATIQTDINKVEAGSSSIFVSGWRPAIGWVGAIALFTYYVPYCLVAVGIWAYQCITTHTIAPRPDLSITDLLSLIGLLLGFGGLRSVDKSQGTSNGH